MAIKASGPATYRLSDVVAWFDATARFVTLTFGQAQSCRPPTSFMLFHGSLDGLACHAAPDDVAGMPVGRRLGRLPHQGGRGRSSDHRVARRVGCDYLRHLG